MFGKPKHRADTGITLIANNCEMSGDIHFNDQLLINGTVKGNLYAEAESKASVTVSETGYIEGNICVPNVIVNGKVDGDIRSSKHIELAAKAEVTGNIYYNLIEMVRGSKVTGNLVNVADAMEQESGSQARRPDRSATETAERDSQIAPVNSQTG
ncbi:MAG: polymer-forming cytoskeletal protein [Pseudomonadales bacterium]